MELLDRYLSAVGANLPKPQRDDILRELAENIRAQIEDKEAELGRALTESEQEAVLRQHGNPLIVAGRYRHDDRSLALGRQIIGPALFPFYIKVLWLNWGIAAIVAALIILVLSQIGVPIRFGPAFALILWTLLANTIVITLIFVGVEKYCARFPDRWDVRQPRDAVFSRLIDYGEANGTPRVSRAESVTYFIASALFLVWLRAIAHSAFWTFGATVGAFRIEPIWRHVYVPFLLLIFASMIQPIVNFVRPDWTRFRSIVRTALGIVGLAILYIILQAGDILAVRSPNPTAADLHVAQTVNVWFSAYMTVFAVACVIVFSFSARRLIRDLLLRYDRLGSFK